MWWLIVIDELANIVEMLLEQILMCIGRSVFDILGVFPVLETPQENYGYKATPQCAVLNIAHMYCAAVRQYASTTFFATWW